MTRLDAKKKGLIVVSVMAILIASWSIFIGPCLRKPSRSVRPVKEAGQFIAEATAKALQGRGSVVVIAMDTDYFDSQIRAFRKVLEQDDTIQLLERNDLKPSELTMTAQGSAPSSEAFLRIYHEHRNVSAIVSLIGPPSFSPSDIAKLDPEGPKLIVFAPMGFGVKKLLENNVIHVAIVPQVPGMIAPGPSAVPATDNGSDPYQVVTPETMQTVQLIEPPPLPVSAK